MAEIGIATRSNVSAWDRSRVHQSSLYASETRRLVANFNGATPKGVLIVSAQWETYAQPQVVMSDAEIAADQRSTSILIKSQMGGPAILKCTATMSDGSVMTQNFRVNVQYAPIYANAIWTTGPQSLIVVAP